MANQKAKTASAPPASLPGGGLKGWFSRNWYYLAAFFLPVALVYIAYLLFGLYPNGDHSVLVLDLNGQYVYYFEAIRDAFHGDGSILYNWERNLSGGYQGVIGYYLASPFTLIVILLPRTMILGALLIMILCKLGAASFAFCYYARKSKHVSPPLALILGISFGMCAYGVIQTIDPMWLDGLVFLPFIALGIEYLVDDGRKLNFIIPLALMCIANFYIGFMCCIFTAIYFVYYVFFGSDKIFKKTPHGKPQQNLFAVIFRMGIASLVAVCCAAFMILPVYNALALGKFDFTVPDWSMKWQFSPLEFLAQFCVNQYNSVNVEGKPEIYCGVLALICLPLFFLNNRIPARKRIGYAFLTIVMFFCMIVRPIDMMWHGGQMPNWLPFRYSFIFSFILLSMVAMTLRYAANIKKVYVGCSFAVLFILLMIIDKQKYLNMKGAIYLDTYLSIWMTIGLMGIYCIFIILLGKKNLSKGMYASIMLSLLTVVGAELTYNAKCEFDDIHTEVCYSSRKSYREYVQSGRDMVAKLEERDGGFFRAEKTYVRTVNDNAGFGLRGITHSSSVMNAKILTFIETMGYTCSTYFSRYDGNTPLADSVLGIKYVFDKNDSNVNVLKKGENSDIGAAYNKLYTDTAKSQSEEKMEVGVYENPNALSIGYMVSKDIERISFFGNDDPFNSQNLLFSTITGNTSFTAGGGFNDWHRYYTPISVTQTEEMEELGITNPRMNQCYQDSYGEQMRFREDGWDPSNPTVHQPDPTVDIFLETASDEPLYLYFKTENQSKVNLWLADQWNTDNENLEMRNTDGSFAGSLGSYFEGDNYRILYVGQFPAGQKLQLRMTLLSDSANTKEKYTIIQNFLFYHFHSDLFEQDMKLIRTNEGQWKLSKYGGRTLEGTITAKENQIMMTSIPAEPGWKVWVDGKPYHYQEVVDGENVDSNFVTLFKAMIGVELEPGEHTVKMRYTPPGLQAGLFALVCGLFCIVLFYKHDYENNAVLQQIRANRKKGIYELEYEDDPDPLKAKKAKEKEKEKEIKESISADLVADELRKLKELLDDGVLSKEEFEEQKKKLLSK